MLSDTCFDVSQTLIDELAHYKMKQETYGYDDALLEKCLNSIAALRAIGFDLDVGGDGSFENDLALQEQIIGEMKMRLTEEFHEKLKELKEKKD
jgi:hypothetical protein